MLVRYPSGLYESVLPKDATDSTSVVYTISDTPPEIRTDLYAPIPDGIRRKSKDPKIYTSSERRSSVGELVYVDSTLIEAQIRSGQPEYKLGQILEFDTTAEQQIVPNFPGKSTQMRHDIARLDTELIGMPDLFATPVGTGETINTAATEAYNMILVQIDGYQQRYDVLQSNIDEYRKTINEINRTINGLDVIISTVGISGVEAVKAELEATKSETETLMNTDIEEINAIPSAIASLKDKLNSLAIFIT